MAAPVEETVLSALKGHVGVNTKLPTPRIIKVYIASLKKGEFTEKSILWRIILNLFIL